MSNGDLKARRKNWTGGNMDAKAVDEELRSIRRAIGSDLSSISTASIITAVTESSISGDRVLTGTSNEIAVTDNGAGNTIVLSIPDPFNPPGIVNVPNTKLEVAGFQTLPILQVQMYTSSTQTTSTSASYADTSLTGSFTPKLSTSKVLLYAAGNFSVGTGDFGHLTIARNGTNLSSTTQGFFTGIQQNNYSSTMIFYDSPATTSAVTYTVRMRNNSGSSLLTWGVSDGVGFSNAVMIAIEIAQ